ncbi:hypothetical protein [Actinophytocola sp.]|uniref:hypothetical protein n=1 Tax=Actinophytocola sp. TaxID=1872138 RepID=UPI00389A0B10
MTVGTVCWNAHMGPERIDDLTDARRLRHEYGERTVAYLLPEIDRIEGQRHGVTGEGMDGIEVDLDALRQAERDLAVLHDDLAAHLTEADDLTGPLGDGKSPVAAPMRLAFQTRAGDEGGVQTALQQYMAELLAVRVTILKTLASYQSVEQETVSRLRRQAEEIA